MAEKTAINCRGSTFLPRPVCFTIIYY